jgi:uncharacterized DUF497 family protein
MDVFDSVEWDEIKRLNNIAKHALDFRDAIYLFRSPYLRLTARTVNGEARSMAVGMLDDIHVAVVYTLRGSALRVISMRKARNDERRHYDEVFGGEPGADQS